MDSQKNRASFAQASSQYASFRPSYPPELFTFLASVCDQRESALDCGTGSGQAAAALADYFTQVTAIDASSEQLAHARKHRRVDYQRMPAEALEFPDASFDLVTVAQALHWFDLETFFAKVKRILRPRGVFAAWGYGFFNVSPEIDAVVERALLKPIDPYWASANQILIDRYRSIPFPFEEIPSPAFELMVTWDLDQLLGFISTWSAVKRYESEVGQEVMGPLRAELSRVWPEGERHAVHMSLATRIGRND